VTDAAFLFLLVLGFAAVAWVMYLLGKVQGIREARRELDRWFREADTQR